MPSFNYEALDAAGRRMTGTMDAPSRGDIMEELNRAGLLPIRASESRASAGRAGARTWRDVLTPEPKGTDITAMTLDVVMLLKGGVTLSEALVLLGQMGGGRWRRRVLRELHVAIATGRLEQALASLAAERQRTEAMRKRLVGAVSYPAFLVVSALAAMTFIFLYVIPQFETALEGYRDKIDPTALMVFNMSSFLRANLQTIVVTLASVVVGGLLLGRLGARRGIFIPILARLPLLRTLFLYESTLKFCRTLAVLVGSGVDISTALRLLRDVVRLPTFADGIDGVIADVRKGRRLSEAVGDRDLLPRHVVQMLRVGEESGRLPDSASRVAVFYEARLDTVLSRAIAVIGPLTMVLVSMLIAWLIISVMTALMSINDVLK